jgi:FKBP-type peptidyl-prolyl cis-trans isomerase
VPAEKVAPRTLSEQEQNSYVVGMMVADYARSVLLTLDKLDVSPDERLFREGLQDALSGKPVLNSSDAQAAMQRIQKQADHRQAELDAASRQALVEIAGKHNTVEKKEDRVWVRLKKGGPAVSKQTPLSLSWEGQLYNGTVFESVTDAAVTRREVLPSWLQRAIRLAGPGGEVRLFILAGSLEGEAPLPAGTGRHELVQYTVSVKKG